MKGQCGWCGNSGVMHVIELEMKQEGSHSGGCGSTGRYQNRPPIPCWHCRGTGTDRFETKEEQALTAAEDRGLA